MGSSAARLRALAPLRGRTTLVAPFVAAGTPLTTLTFAGRPRAALAAALASRLGSALIIENVVAPLELAHLPYKKDKTFEDYVGLRGLERLGKKRWQDAVEDVVSRLQAALVADSVVIGGGNAKKLKRLPPGSRLGDNMNAFLGGFRLWEDEKIKV